MASETYDLVIRGARVIDPTQDLDGPADIGVREGCVATVGRVNGKAAATLDAAGLIASAGWIDLHAHVAYRLGRTSVDPDGNAGVARGVTTVVDAGSCGAGLFDAFRAYVMAAASTRVLAFLNVSLRTTIAPRHGTWENFDQRLTIAAAERHAGAIVGIKVLASRTHCGAMGLVPVKLAGKAARLAGTRVMCHIGNAPPVIEDVLGCLDAGDIVAHCWHGKPGGLFDRLGRPIPAARSGRGSGRDLRPGARVGEFLVRDRAPGGRRRAAAPRREHRPARAQHGRARARPGDHDDQTAGSRARPAERSRSGDSGTRRRPRAGPGDRDPAARRLRGRNPVPNAVGPVRDARLRRPGRAGGCAGGGRFLDAVVSALDGGQIPVEPARHKALAGTPGAGGAVRHRPFTLPERDPEPLAARVDGLRARRPSASEIYAAAVSALVEAIARLAEDGQSAGIAAERYAFTGGLTAVPSLRGRIQTALARPILRVVREAAATGAARLGAIAAGIATAAPSEPGPVRVP